MLLVADRFPLLWRTTVSDHIFFYLSWSIFILYLVSPVSRHTRNREATKSSIRENASDAISDYAFRKIPRRLGIDFGKQFGGRSREEGKPNHPLGSTTIPFPSEPSNRMLAMHRENSIDSVHDEHDQQLHVSKTKRDLSSCIKRVAWFHVPKTGTSIGTTFAHYANCKLPPEAVMPRPGECPGDPEVCFITKWPVKKYFPRSFWMKNGNWGNHDGISRPVYDLWKGDFFGMFRKPASRMLSAWNHFGKQQNPKTFADNAAGGMTKMLAGQEYGLDCLMKALNKCKEKVEPNLQLALTRLREGFKFIGLSEEFNLSVCLFHAMFGGQCLAAEFTNMRPGHYSSKVKKSNPLEEYSDPFDEKIYDEASRIFWSNVAQFNVTPWTCQHVFCPNVGHLWAGSSASSSSGNVAHSTSKLDTKNNTNNSYSSKRGNYTWAPTETTTTKHHDVIASVQYRTVHFACKNRVAWFHAPQTGTSIGTTFAHHANCKLPSEAAMPLTSSCRVASVCFTMKWSVKTYFQRLLWMKDGDWGNYNRVTQQVYETWKGQFFGMFRKPASRMRSAWEFFAKEVDPKSFAEKAAGGVTKMLAGQEYGLACLKEGLELCKDKVVPDLTLALNRLKKGFKFIGLSEEFKLSICLFHAMFGGSCLPAEFASTRLGHNISELPNNNPFENFADLDDDAIYKEASQIFWMRVKQYNVTAWTCQHRFCPEAGIYWQD